MKSYDDNRRKPKLFLPEKFSRVVKLLYLGKASHLFEKKVQELTQSTYNQVKLRVIFVSKPVFRLELKDSTSHLGKIYHIYKFNCFCE